MRDPNGVYGIWDYIPKDSRRRSERFLSFLQPRPSAENEGRDKVIPVTVSRQNSGNINKAENPGEADKEQSWVQYRKTSFHKKLTKKGSVSSAGLTAQPSDQEQHQDQVKVHHDDNVIHYDENDVPEEVTCGKQFQTYCAFTSLHGYRYISEPHRSYAERIFWICWCIFGVCSACYMMSKIWTKWAKNPVLTSVATTNYPVTNVIFPAVTICTVDKAVTEKLIIQGCRYNYTLSQMKTIISMLVDPDARNNDHFNSEKIHVKPEAVLKYLRLVAPKCDDYLLTCKWNSASVPCKHIFRLTLTDSGYCCTFNAIETKKMRKDSKFDLESMVQEEEFDYLQKAVWDYTDNFREQNGAMQQQQMQQQGEAEGEVPSPILNSFSCIREYDDDLFPGICQYLQKCRESQSCRMKNTPKVSVGGISGTEDPIVPEYGESGPQQSSFNIFQETFPLRVAGAGRSRGLTLMLDTLRCDSIPTDSFKGLRILVHNADDFPAVDERGIIVGPGMETQIGVTAIETYSASVLHEFSSETRGCFFPHEFPLNFYTEYSRSACVVECETEFISRECQCSRYYDPGNYSICTLQQNTDCVKKSVDVIQKKSVPVPMSRDEATSSFHFNSRKESQQERSCSDFCLPACNETFYNVFITAADFPNQPQANQTKMIREAIQQGHVHLNDIAYVSGSISVVRVYFRESSIMQYKRDELFTWEDFVSNIGGVLSLCLGFSLLSLVELIYFFTMRMSIDKKRIIMANYHHNHDNLDLKEDISKLPEESK